MQPFSSSFESAIKDSGFLDNNVPIETELLAKIACNIFDIPVHKNNEKQNNMIESLHVFFTLF